MQAYCQSGCKESSLLYSGEVKIGIRLWVMVTLCHKWEIADRKRTTQGHKVHTWLSSRYMDYKQRLIKLSLLPLEYRRQIRDLIFLFKIRTGLLDIDHSCFLKQTTSSRYNTRNFSYLNYHVRLARQDYFKYSYFLRVTVLWNDLPQDLKCITLLTTFKREIINFFKTKLKHYCLPGK